MNYKAMSNRDAVRTLLACDMTLAMVQSLYSSGRITTEVMTRFSRLWAWSGVRDTPDHAAAEARLGKRRYWRRLDLVNTAILSCVPGLASLRAMKKRGISAASSRQPRVRLVRSRRAA